MSSYVYKCFELRICSFYGNSNLKNAILLHISLEFQKLEINLAFSALGNFVNMKRINWETVYIQWYNKTICPIFFKLTSGFVNPRTVMFTKVNCTLSYDPYKDLLWLAKTSLHWLWQILMSNRDELKTGWHKFFFSSDRLLKKNLKKKNERRSAVGKVSGYRCVSDCRSRGCEFDHSPVPYFRRDWSWNNFYGHSPPSAE